MNHLECDKDGCKRLVYYVEWACDGMEYAFCKQHGDEFLINEQYPNRIKYLMSRIRKTSKQIKCQNSREGHTFPPPPKPKLHKIADAQKPADFYFDVASSDTMAWGGGASHACSKCGFTYHEPMPMYDFNISDIGSIEFKVNTQTTKDSMGMIPA